MKIFKLIMIWVFTPLAVYADGVINQDNNFFYIGGEAGIVAPVKSKFMHKNSRTKITLKKSHMYTGQLGYSFYPGMSIEFSATHQPRYKLAYDLPANDFISHAVPGNTRVVSNVYMINLIYDLAEFKEFTPFVIFGGGIARVTVKPTTSNYQGVEFFRIQKTVKNCGAWQAGLGVSKKVTENFSLHLSWKLQVAHNVRINYKTLDAASGNFVNASPIKKTIGVAEYGIGFTYKLPF
jgi:opacity protein-like surface antigen